MSTVFQYKTGDSTKHTLNILERDEQGNYHVLIDGIDTFVDQRWMNEIIVVNKNESINGSGKSLIFG